MKVKKIALIAGMVMFLAACNSGLDHKLDSAHGMDAYKASLAEATKDMKKEEIEAFDFYASQLSLEKLAELYPSATPRKVIHGQAQTLIDSAEKLTPEFERMIPEFDKEYAALESGIRVVNPIFSVEKDFFGDQPRVRTKVQNTSGQVLTALKWKVELFIDGSNSPVASTEIEDDYKASGGIKSGYEYPRQFTLGFVRGDDRFTTLEIQNAAKREVRMTLLINECTDLKGRQLAARNPHRLLEEMKALSAKAKAHKEI